jgi:hypothetical protein
VQENGVGKQSWKMTLEKWCLKMVFENSIENGIGKWHTKTALEKVIGK